jgi:hypothetical protein
MSKALNRISMMIGRTTSIRKKPKARASAASLKVDLLGQQAAFMVKARAVILTAQGSSFRNHRSRRWRGSRPIPRIRPSSKRGDAETAPGIEC